MTAMEIARFTVRPENADAMLARRPAMVDALREDVPGFLGLRLVRLDERTWLDIVEWTDRAAAEAAQESVMQHPACLAVLQHIEEVVSMEHGTVEQHADDARGLSA